MLGVFEAGLFPGVNYYLSWSVFRPFYYWRVSLTDLLRSCHSQLVQAF